jgi:hypothetical protein
LNIERGAAQWGRAPVLLLPIDQESAIAVLNSITGDPAVKEAGRCWVRTIPATSQALVSARLAAQADRGVPEDERAPMYPSEAETFLMPLILRTAPIDEEVSLIREGVRESYGEFADIVLTFMVRCCMHAMPEGLRRALIGSAPVAAEV